MCKKLCRTEALDSVESSSGEYVLEYYLTHKKHAFEGKGISFLSYGIEVRMRNVQRESYDEIRSAEEIFASEEATMELLNEIADGLVTPCTLEDVIVDFLSEALSN